MYPLRVKIAILLIHCFILQPLSIYQWNIIASVKSVVSDPLLPRRLSRDVWPPSQPTVETTIVDTPRLKYTEDGQCL